MNLYVIFDKLAQEAGPLFESKNDATAVRSFHRALLEKSDPSEYQLLRVGTYDREAVKIRLEDPPAHVSVVARDAEVVR